MRRAAEEAHLGAGHPVQGIGLLPDRLREERRLGDQDAIDVRFGIDVVFRLEHAFAFRWRRVGLVRLTTPRTADRTLVGQSFDSTSCASAPG